MRVFFRSVVLVLLSCFAHVAMAAETGGGLFDELHESMDEQGQIAQKIVDALKGFPENVLELSVSGKPDYDTQRPPAEAGGL